MNDKDHLPAERSNLTPIAAFAMEEKELITVLGNSLYPGAQEISIRLVLSYCKASGLDPMLKPVHIVPMYDSKTKGMRDVVMPGIGLYRTQAARSGQFAGVSEPTFGPMVTQNIGGREITFPEFCRVTAMRQLPGGQIASFTAVEYWIENYAVKGGYEKSTAPNTMWCKRPRGQIAKCAEAQALRKAFPEAGAQPTAEEMEGREYSGDVIEGDYERKALVEEPRSRSGANEYGEQPLQPETEHVAPPAAAAAPAAPPKKAPPANDTPASPGQVNLIKQRLKVAGLDEAALLKEAGITSLDGITTTVGNALLKAITAAVEARDGNG